MVALKHSAPANRIAGRQAWLDQMLGDMAHLSSFERRSAMLALAEAMLTTMDGSQIRAVRERMVDECGVDAGIIKIIDQHLEP